MVEVEKENGSPSYDELVLAIHRGPLEKPRWSSLVGLFGRAFKKRAFSLIFRPPSKKDNGGLIHVGGTAYWRQKYDGYFYALDPFVRLPEGRAVTLSEFVGASTLARTEYYQDFMRNIQLKDVLGMDASSEGGLAVRVRLCRHADEAAFNGIDARLLERLMPHLLVASRACARLHHATTEQRIFQQSFEGMAIGTLVLDGNLMVRHHDATATNLLASAGASCQRGQRLSLSSRRLLQQLHEQVAVLLEEARGENKSRIVRYLQLRNTDGDPISVTVQMLPEGDRANPLEPEVIVHLCDPKTRLSPDPGMLINIFGFTTTEAHVASSLAAGDSAEHIAVQSGVSLNTVRTQIRALYQKTGVSKLTDLIRVLTRTVVTG